MVAAKKTKALREGANVMLIIGCDFHPGFQQIAIFDNQTGAYEERRLSHRAEAEQFYRSLAGQENDKGYAVNSRNNIFAKNTKICWQLLDCVLDLHSAFLHFVQKHFGGDIA